jgi:hypothetical protein
MPPTLTKTKCVVAVIVIAIGGLAFLGVRAAVMATLAGDRDAPANASLIGLKGDAQRLGSEHTIYWLAGNEVNFSTTHHGSTGPEYEIVGQVYSYALNRVAVDVVTFFAKPVDVSCCVRGTPFGTWHRSDGEIVRVFAAGDVQSADLRGRLESALAPFSG